MRTHPWVNFRTLLPILAASLLLLAVACGGTAATPTVIEKEVIVEREVIKEVYPGVERLHRRRSRRQLGHFHPPLARFYRACGPDTDLANLDQGRRFRAIFRGCRRGH